MNSTRRIITVTTLLCVMACVILPASPALSLSIIRHYDMVSPYVDVYNDNIRKVPGFLTVLIGNQQVQVNFEFTSGDDEIAGAIIGSDGSVQQFLNSAPPNPTMLVVVNPGTVERLVNENSGEAVLAAIGSDIHIRGVGIIGQLRAFAFRMLAGLARRLV